VPDRVLQRNHVDLALQGVDVQMRRGAREEQQDAAYAGSGVLAVADGMGGHARGAEAASAALRAFASAVEGGAQLGDAAGRADEAVRALVDAWSYTAPGTTLVAAHLDEATVSGVWSGDSRAYRLRTDGVLELLTEDHRDFMGGIEHALGAFDPGPLHLDRFEVAVDGTAGLLLCTDGLSGPFEDAWSGGRAGDVVTLVDDDPTLTIGTLLTERGLAALVDLAAAVGSDNVTALWWPLQKLADA
jgi:serine/threonine protein phosphatase PrpC